MYKSMFTLSDTADIEEKFEGYTDGSLWNGWQVDTVSYILKNLQGVL